MTQIKNNINTYADLTAYNADTNKDYPNVSYIQGTDEVKWVGEDPTLIIATYDVGVTTNYKLLHNDTNIEKMWIDGVLQPSVVTSYQFATTGEHIVKYKLTDNVSVGAYTFYYLKTAGNGIKSVIIPSNVTSIGQGAFSDNNTFESITIEATTPPTIYNNAVFGGTCPIYVPAESVAAYQAASGWSDYASRIQAIPSV